MRFWDTSAIVPLIVTEPGSTLVRDILRRDQNMVVWWSAEVECVSALSKVFRNKNFDRRDVERALERLERLLSSWSEIEPTDEVRVRAERLLFGHHLKAADGMQLGAALLWAEDRTRRAEFVSLDNQQRTAARREGFDVLPAKWNPKELS